MKIMHWSKKSGALGFVALLMAGCTMPTHVFESKKVDYKTQSADSAPLELPPDMSGVQTDDRYSVPDGHGTSYSQYAKEQAAVQVQASASPKDDSAVLPKPGGGVREERDGIYRWLVVKGTPDQIWPVLENFWKSNGFKLEQDDPKTGWMETEWTPDQDMAQQDLFHSVLNKVVNNLFSSPVKNKFRTRIDRGSEPGTVEIYITQQGMEETRTTDGNGVGWRVRSEDVQLENRYVRKLAIHLGDTEQQAEAMVAEKDKPAPAAVPAAPAATAVASAEETPSSSTHATLTKLPNGDPLLSLQEPFDRAWHRVGMGLDRAGFTIEDRDRAAGVYYVSYTDPDAKVQKSLWSRLAFWRPDDNSAATKTYRVTVTSISGEGSKVDLRDKDDHVVSPDMARRILTLLYEQVR